MSEVGFSSYIIWEPGLLVRVRETDKGFMMLWTVLRVMLLFSGVATVDFQDLGTSSRSFYADVTLGK